MPDLHLLAFCIVGNSARIQRDVESFLLRNHTGYCSEWFEMPGSCMDVVLIVNVTRVLVLGC